MNVPARLLTDRWDRRIDYLRVSVTDRCNYRCTYCMPAEGLPAVPEAARMSLDELMRIVRLLVDVGVRRVRVTGGEPLIRKGVVGFISQINDLPQVEEIAMTTNGHLLARHAEALHAAGLRSLNVSLDTFDADRFATVTRGGDLAEVLNGIAAAERAGFENIRINAVAVRGTNDDQVADLVEGCWRRGWTPRFIELMPIGDLQGQSARVPSAELIAALRARFELRQLGRSRGGLPQGPAAYWVVTDGPYVGRRVGLISPMTDHGFCADCNRARLTARGGFRACLGNDDEVSLLQLVRAGADNAALLTQMRRAVHAKLEAHRMNQIGFVPLSVMTGIGG
ncbi:MAG: cyclic pyranopterin phosphate synthase [Bradymonadia bacterium]|jgi:cyclic pyranopterin phosphate synthase